MQIVIEIDEDIAQGIIDGKEEASRNIVRSFQATIADAIKNGTPLPKGHGRLIDADKLRETMEKDPRKALSFVDLTDFVWLAPTIIEGSESE